MRVSASHPASLAGQTWALPKSAYAQPVLDASSRANGDVRDDGVGEWVVTAKQGTAFSFTATLAGR